MCLYVYQSESIQLVSGKRIDFITHHTSTHSLTHSLLPSYNSSKLFSTEKSCLIDCSDNYNIINMAEMIGGAELIAVAISVSCHLKI